MSTAHEDQSVILYCSFCGKSQHDVQKLVTGPGVCICDDCIVLCLNIVTKDGAVVSGLSSESEELFRNQAHNNVLNKVENLIKAELNRNEVLKELEEAFKLLQNSKAQQKPIFLTGLTILSPNKE